MPVSKKRKSAPKKTASKKQAVPTAKTMSVQPDVYAMLPPVVALTGDRYLGNSPFRLWAPSQRKYHVNGSLQNLNPHDMMSEAGIMLVKALKAEFKWLQQNVGPIGTAGPAGLSGKYGVLVLPTGENRPLALGIVFADEQDAAAFDEHCAIKYVWDEKEHADKALPFELSMRCLAPSLDLPAVDYLPAAGQSFAAVTAAVIDRWSSIVLGYLPWADKELGAEGVEYSMEAKLVDVGNQERWAMVWTFRTEESRERFRAYADSHKGVPVSVFGKLEAVKQ